MGREAARDCTHPSPASDDVITPMQVYSMFLDTLSKFITEYREHLDDWLFLLLLRLLQRSGTDMLSSVLFKLQMVLENIRWDF